MTIGAAGDKEKHVSTSRNVEKQEDGCESLMEHHGLIAVATTTEHMNTNSSDDGR